MKIQGETNVKAADQTFIYWDTLLAHLLLRIHAELTLTLTMPAPPITTNDPVEYDAESVVSDTKT